MNYVSQLGEVPCPVEEAKEADRIIGALDRLCSQAEGLNSYSSTKLLVLIRQIPEENCAVESVFVSAEAPLFERMASLLCKINRHMNDIARTIDRVEL